MAENKSDIGVRGDGDRRGRGAALPKGHEHILWVDDEQSLARVAKRALERLGYRVSAFTDPVSALEAFVAQSRSFDLLVTDQMMPGLTGFELSQKCLAIRPDLPVILCTGYSESVTPEAAKAAGIRDFVMKPLELHQMANIVRAALDA